MKAILVIDVPTLDDGRHLCNECPIWNRDHFLCEYDFNTEAKGCPLKPLPDCPDVPDTIANDVAYIIGWNDCIVEISKEQKEAKSLIKNEKESVSNAHGTNIK